MSDTGNDTVKAYLYTDSSEYREYIGVVRFIGEWVDDTHQTLDTLPPAKLRVRLSEVNSQQAKFSAACARLLGGLDPAIYEQDYSYVKHKMRVVQNKIDDLKVRAEELATPFERDPSATSTPFKVPRPSQFTSPTSKLPVLPIPRFDGRPDSWISFIDQFDSVVDNQPDLTPTLKLHYLVGALSDEPRRLIQHLKIEGGNYPTARDLLKRRYHNLRVLADTHLAQIINLPNINSKLGGLRVSFLNPLLSSYRCLERLELPVAHWSYMLVHICLTKLPSELKSRFERRYGDNPESLPTFDHLISFLEDECRHYDNVGSADIVDNTPQSTHSPRPTPKPRLRSPPSPRAYVVVTPPPSATCFMCKSTMHYLRECPEFQRLPIRERTSYVRDARLCYRCLDRHSLSSCRRNYRCGTCRRSSHHTMLCYDDIPSPRERTVSFRDVVASSSPPRSGGRVSPPRPNRWYSPPRSGGRYSPPRSGGRSPPPRANSPHVTHHYAHSRESHHPTPPARNVRAYSPTPLPSRRMSTAEDRSYRGDHSPRSSRSPTH